MSDSTPENRPTEDSSTGTQDKEREILLATDSAESFRFLVESVKDYAIFLLDPQGYVVSWNAGAERIKGYTRDEIVGKHFSTFYTEEAKSIRHPEHELEVAIAEGRYEEEGWRVRKDGTMFWANVVITALFNETGVHRGFAKVTRDMTDRRRMEEELRHSRDVLEQRVEERTTELTRANQILQAEVERRQLLEDALRRQTQQLKSDAESKDDFMAMLAHELRNPMGVLSNALHVLTLTVPGTPAFERSKDVALRQISHQTRLVDDLLDVSRIRRGKIELNRENFDLPQMLRQVMDDLRPTYDAARVTLSLHAPQEKQEIFADPTRLTQVFTNLLDNARKFTPPGGRVDVRVEAPNEAGEVSLTVRDTGIGIEPEILSQLFEPFIQADRSLERSGGGLGLGLALVKGLTELHGGTVTARSEGRGKGSEFIVTLPIGSGKRASRTDDSAWIGPEATSRVLVIEDIRDAAETMRDLLEVFGYRVVLAYDGNDGLQKARDLRPDVVLCDIGLPGIDGYVIAAQLRQNPTTAGIPLVAVTGYGKEEDRNRTQKAGFRAHLTKPVNPDELRRLLDDLAVESG